MKSLLIYLALISVFSAIITAYDKLAAKKFPRNRVPEKVLFLTAIAGGSVSMYAVMQIIRHKTRHKRFMIGLPVIMVLQAAVICFTLFVK